MRGLALLATKAGWEFRAFSAEVAWKNRKLRTRGCHWPAPQATNGTRLVLLASLCVWGHLYLVLMEHRLPLRPLVCNRTATKWNNCFFLVPDAVGGGLLPSAASATATALAPYWHRLLWAWQSERSPGPTTTPGTNCSCASGILAYVCMQFAENGFSSSSKVQPTPGV